jgi:hypothetical protein
LGYERREQDRAAWLPASVLATLRGRKQSNPAEILRRRTLDSNSISLPADTIQLMAHLPFLARAVVHVGPLGHLRAPIDATQLRLQLDVINNYVI